VYASCQTFPPSWTGEARHDRRPPHHPRLAWRCRNDARRRAIHPAYDGNDLLHDIELAFPGLSYRNFFLAFCRARDPARWFKPEGSA
jgi:hypothetical protein